MSNYYWMCFVSLLSALRNFYKTSVPPVNNTGLIVSGDEFDQLSMRNDYDIQPYDKFLMNILSSQVVPIYLSDLRYL